MADRIYHGTALVRRLVLTILDTVLTCRNFFSHGTDRTWRFTRLFSNPSN